MKPKLPEQRRPSSAVRILVVDDHEDTLALQAMLLRRKGYQVLTATTAEAAIERVAEQVIDVLLSDIRLPDRSGVDLMRELRIMGVSAGIAVSGIVDDDLVAECEAAGFTQVLAKPLPPERLLQAVEELRPSVAHD